MPRVRDLLYRFRPAGAPGGAGPTGVPVDRPAELAHELEPVFAALADVERECDDVLAAARREAEALRARAAEHARALVAHAHARVDAERAAAAAQVRRRAERESDDTLTRARRSAVELRQAAEAMMPSFVGRVVARAGSAVRTPADDQPGGGSAEERPIAPLPRPGGEP